MSINCNLRSHLWRVDVNHGILGFGTDLYKAELGIQNETDIFKLAAPPGWTTRLKWDQSFVGKFRFGLIR